ncbi:MAG: hypothetical protein RJQ01_08020 [Microcella sp.]|uniref:hypothetical protein n=1 Tax=Microcella sp. TaxID=1913979 RepID=UPI003314F6BA
MLICDRCYNRLRRRIEAAPELVGLLRSIADPLKATAYDRTTVSGSTPEGTPAPVAADLLDASADIMHVIGGGKLEPGAASDTAYSQALEAVQFVLSTFDALANDADAVLEWWRLVMSHELEDHPEFWTITRALARWPLEDRARWASQPCPECGTRSVKVTPPRHRFARSWFACASCGWRKTDKDDDGLWAAAFGQHAREGRRERGSDMGEQIKPKDIDLGEAIKSGVQYVLDNAEGVQRAGRFGVPAAAIIGAVPAIGEQLALIAEDLGQHVRANYANGDLIAGGVKLAVTAIRDAVEGRDGAAALAALATELAETPGETVVDAETAESS